MNGRYASLPPHLAVPMRFGPTADGAAVTGIRIERIDGRAIQARDLRDVRLPPWYVTTGDTAAGGYISGPAVIPSRRGPRDEGDEKHRRVWDLWCHAQSIAPKAPIRWLLPRLHVSDATARRWVRKALDRAAELGWEARKSPAFRDTARRHLREPVRIRPLTHE